MMRQAPTLNAEVQSLSQIHEAVARAEAVLKGDFRKELAAMTTLRDDLKERQGVIDTVAKAESVKAEADAYSAKVKAEAEAIRKTAQETQIRASAKLSTVEAREVNVANRERDTERRDQELTERVASEHKATKEREGVLVKREGILADREADYRRRVDALSAKEKAVRGMIEAMSA